MAIEKQVCPKCSAPMKPGYPLETFGEAGGFKSLTLWIDGTPILKKGWLGEYLDARQTNKRFLLGVCCEGCGFVETYAVSESDTRYHARD